MDIRIKEGPKPLNAIIAEALGWRVWEDLRPGREGQWFQERDSRSGFVQVRTLIDYLDVLREIPELQDANEHAA